MVKTCLDTLPIDLKIAIYDMARPYCITCGDQYSKNYNNKIKKYCECEICEGCLLNNLWEKTGCDMPGECGSFLCSKFCFNSIEIEIKSD